MRAASVQSRRIQFAVVREDPAVERALIDRLDARRCLLVASGGCTALTLGAARPDLELTVFDVNPAQLDLVQRKLTALREGRIEPDLWGVGVDDPASLSACGNFESLFRALRRFLEDFAVPRDELVAAFTGGADPSATFARLVGSPYWPVAFDAHFGDALLETMFGPAAIQNAPPGSYPRHFQRAFERGLARGDATRNRFLHHVLLGHYVDTPGARPVYLDASPAPRGPEFVEGTLAEVDDLGRFDLVSLSNVPDWMSASEVRDLAALLTERVRPGAAVLLRTLNTRLPFADALGPGWRVESSLARSLHALDQSLFYSDLLIATKR